MNQLRQFTSNLSDYLHHVVLFLFLIFFFYLTCDYIFFYQEKSSLFLFSNDYLTEHLNQPGGPLVWAGNLITAFFYYPFAGTILISLLISMTVLLISGIIRFLTGAESKIIPLLYGFLLFLFHTNYQYLVINSLGLSLQLLLFYLTLRYLKSWIPVLVFPFWYMLTGSFAWIFGIMFTISLVDRSVKTARYIIIFFWGIIVAVILLLKEFVLFHTIKTLLVYPFSKSGTGSQLLFFTGFAIMVAFLPLIARFSLISFRKVRLPLIGSRLAPSLTLLVVLIIAGVIRYNKKTRQYFTVEKLFCQGAFHEVVEYNKANPSVNVLTIYLNNVALCELGKLNDEFFHFRQDPSGQTLFLKWEMSGEILRRGGYFYYTIGMINEAQRWAYENLIMKGMTPEDLKMLIKTEIISGNYEVASKYISIFKKSPFYKKEANGYQKLLFNDDAVDSDPKLGLKKKERISHDFFSITDDPYINVERILSVDSLNRKAYEYKLAYMLLKKDYQGIEAQLQELDKYGFTKIPIHIEEAAEAYRVLNMGPLPYQGNIPFSPGTSQRFIQFLQTFQQYGNDLKSAEPALRRKFGNTFWYWAFYR